MAWERDLFDAVKAALDHERTHIRTVAGGAPDERLGLFWHPEVALGRVVWKGLAGRFGVDRVHAEVAATAFDKKTDGECDFVIELPGDPGEVLWLELKLLQRVWPSAASGWNDWRSWTQPPYLSKIADDLWRWSNPPSAQKNTALGCHHHGLLLLTFWGPVRADLPAGVVPEGAIIDAHLSARQAPALSAFSKATYQQDDCREVAAHAPNTGHDIFLQADLLLRRV